MGEGSEGWRGSYPGLTRGPAPNLHPPVEVAVDGYVIGGTTLAFCGETERVRQSYHSETGREIIRDSSHKNQRRLGREDSRHALASLDIYQHPVSSPLVLSHPVPELNLPLPCSQPSQVSQAPPGKDLSLHLGVLQPGTGSPVWSDPPM